MFIFATSKRDAIRFDNRIVRFDTLLNKDDFTSKGLASPFRGFLFYITFINGFQLRTIKRFHNKVDEKRQINKSEYSKITKVEIHVIIKKLALI